MRPLDFDYDRTPRSCDLCERQEIQVGSAWGAEAELIQMYWHDVDKLTMCQYCKEAAEMGDLVVAHDWKAEGF